MHPTEVIEAYIDDTVRLLPRRHRDDVATELRSLLNEELQARARDSGRPIDDSLALALVRDYGRPNEVAARYRAPLAIIAPADSTNFLRAAIIGAGALLLLGCFGRWLPAYSASIDSRVTLGILAWLGFLVVAFGIKNWARQRWPATAAWAPRDRDRVSRLGSAAVVLVATPCICLYAAPAQVLDLILGGRLDTSWAAYTPEFQRLRLPIFIGLLVSLLVLRSLAAVQGRWRRLTRRIDIGLNLALACLTLGFAVEGHLFESSRAEEVARNVLALIGVIYVPSVAVLVYGELGRRDPAV